MLVSRLRARISSSGFCDLWFPMRCAHSSTDRRTRHKVALGGVPTGFGLGADPIRTLRTAALLRDIGKVGVPDEIVSKADALDESEWEVMRQHPVIGERIIGAIPGMGAVARIVRHGDERGDGNGYPDGLAGSESA